MEWNLSYTKSLALGVVCICLASCGSNDLNDKRAQKEIEYVLEPSTKVIVEDGIVTFTGTFPDEVSMKNAQEKAERMKGIKSVVNNATITSSSLVIPASETTP